jgi:hypothetical protein
LISEEKMGVEIENPHPSKGREGWATRPVRAFIWN